MAKQQPQYDEDSDEPVVVDTRPRYELIEKAYINDTLHEIGAKITYEGQPGWHMKPLNKAAKELVAQHFPNGQSFMDPILSMTQIVPEKQTLDQAAVINTLTAQIAILTAQMSAMQKPAKA
jgi:hypothetical protein